MLNLSLDIIHLISYNNEFPTIIIIFIVLPPSHTHVTREVANHTPNDKDQFYSIRHRSLDKAFPLSNDDNGKIRDISITNIVNRNGFIGGQHINQAFERPDLATYLKVFLIRTVCLLGFIGIVSAAQKGALCLMS